MPRRDDAAFADFATARFAALHRSAYLIVADEQLAQDLVQEALAKTYVALPRLREVGNLEAYARRVVATTAITWFRRKGWNNETATEHLPDLVGPAPTEEVAQREWLWQALRELPIRQRTAIVLRYYEDLTEAQTAHAMGCATGTVKSQVSAGLRTLRKRLGDDVALVAELEGASA
ncbi:SigE family RNA polymerase sigma factor [Nocardioides sp. Bht2]|uniref:SigE family RNA polymerase sigma factor n=1 Tax=Nocardioides sp. Bht2 TaxID=3392297 RepID=UPI0039B3942A